MFFRLPDSGVRKSISWISVPRRAEGLDDAYSTTIDVADICCAVTMVGSLWWFLVWRCQEK